MPETNRGNDRSAANSLLVETRARTQRRQLAGYSPIAGNLRDRETAWWAPEDSNRQPDRYERSALTVEVPSEPLVIAWRRVLAIEGHR